MVALGLVACAGDDGGGGNGGAGGAAGMAGAMGGTGGGGGTAGAGGTGSGGSAGTGGAGGASGGAGGTGGTGGAPPDAGVDAGDSGDPMNGTAQPGEPCVRPSDCFVPNSCVYGLCVADKCEQAFAASGTAAADYDQTPEDCAQLVCDGAGKLRSLADPDDAPSTGCASTIVETTGDYFETVSQVPFGINLRVNVYELDVTRTLDEVEIMMDVEPATLDVHFVVLEGDEASGTYDEIWLGEVGLATGVELFSSGPIDGVTLEAGKHYAIGVVYDEGLVGPGTDNQIDWCSIEADAPVELSFGSLIGTRGQLVEADADLRDPGSQSLTLDLSSSSPLGVQRLTTSAP